jgi:hypothetical protein
LFDIYVFYQNIKKIEEREFKYDEKEINFEYSLKVSEELIKKKKFENNHILLISLNKFDLKIINKYLKVKLHLIKKVLNTTKLDLIKIKENIFEVIENNYINLNLIGVLNDEVIMKKLFFNKIQFEKNIEIKIKIKEMEFMCEVEPLNLNMELDMKIICKCHGKIINKFDENDKICSESKEHLNKNEITESISIRNQSIPIYSEFKKIEQPYVLNFVNLIILKEICQTYLTGNNFIIYPSLEFISFEKINENDSKFSSINSYMEEKECGILLKSKINIELNKNMGYENYYLIFPNNNNKYLNLKKISTLDEIAPNLEKRTAEKNELMENKVKEIFQNEKIVEYNPFHYSTKYHQRIEKFMSIKPINILKRKRIIDNLESKNIKK